MNIDDLLNGRIIIHYDGKGESDAIDDILRSAGKFPKGIHPVDEETAINNPYYYYSDSYPACSPDVQAAKRALSNDSAVCLTFREFVIGMECDDVVEASSLDDVL